MEDTYQNLDDVIKQAESLKKYNNKTSTKKYDDSIQLNKDTPKKSIPKNNQER